MWARKGLKIVILDNLNDKNDKNYQNLFLNQMILGSILVLEQMFLDDMFLWPNSFSTVIFGLNDLNQWFWLNCIRPN